MKQLPAVWGVVCLAALVLGTGVASGQLNGVVVGWGSQVLLEPSALDDLAEVTPGGYHFLGLKLDGTLLAWGDNDKNQCDVPEQDGGFDVIAACFWQSLTVKGTSTPVEESFYAALAPEGDGVVLRWSLEGCPDGNGFAIHRAPSAEGPYRCITPDPLPLTQNGTYSDEDVWPGGTFWYELRVMTQSGSEALATEIRPYVRIPGQLEPGLRFVRPNPAVSRVSVGYLLPESWRFARLSIHDVAGRLLKRLDPVAGTSGLVEVEWDGTDESGWGVASGVYFIRLDVDGVASTEAVVLLR